jgi:hypothetical protein
MQLEEERLSGWVVAVNRRSQYLRLADGKAISLQLWGQYNARPELPAPSTDAQLNNNAMGDSALYTLGRGGSRGPLQDVSWRWACCSLNNGRKCPAVCARVQLQLLVRALHPSDAGGSGGPLRHRHWLGQQDLPQIRLLLAPKSRRRASHALAPAVSPIIGF